MPFGRTPTPLVDRIRASVAVDPVTGCWIWQKLSHRNGYGKMWVGSRSDSSRRLAYAHRVAYEALVGPVADELDLDHLCRTPACCNPAHLEPVSRRVNILRGEGPPAHQARQTHCKRGHEFTPDNTYTHHDKRYCRTCKRAAASAWKAQKRCAAALSAQSERAEVER